MQPWRHFAASCALLALLGLPSQAPAQSDKPVFKDLVLKGDARCTSCHDETDSPNVLRIGKSKHGTVADTRTPTCTGCHGQSTAHEKEANAGAKRPAKPDITFGKKSLTPVQSRNDTCLDCHEGGNRITWQSSTHARQEVACTNCHAIHTGHDAVRDKTMQTEVCYACHKEQRAQMNRMSHHPVPEGNMACSSCHNVHGNFPKALVRASTNETCYICHTEKRGPFVHNHQPVTEDCGICHQPHGTNTPNLLVRRPPMLCVGCHVPTSHPSQPPALIVGASTLTLNTNSRIFGTEARGCPNCHTNIHGGNSTQNNITTQRFRR